MDLTVQLLARPALMVLLVAASVSFALPADVITAGTRVKRVAGGRKVEIAVIPYQARIEHPNGTCGGTIIHPSHVLTAKHCVKEKFDVKEMQVVVGTPSGRGRPEVTRHVLRVVPFPDKTQLAERQRWLPPDVDSNDVMGDLALVQVYPPFPTDRIAEIRPVEMQTTRGYVADYCILSGWGITKMNDTSEPRLRAAHVEVFSRDECKKKEKRLKADFICAGSRKGGVDACDGDSGGPLVCQGKLTGVVKGGRGCGESLQVSKYTEVALYVRWLAEVIGIDEQRLGSAWRDA